MKGHVSTPEDLTEDTVQELLDSDPPSSDDRILYPGIGTAPFAAAVEETCKSRGWELPKGVGIELDPTHLKKARQRELDHVSLQERDFLEEDVVQLGEFDYIVGNPPYVPIDKLSESEKSRYRDQFATATGRFDLYLLFFEQSIDLLAKNGKLLFVTPEKFEYVESAAPLRKILTRANLHIDRIEHIDRRTFKSNNTFPCVTEVRHKSKPDKKTRVTLRDGTAHKTDLPSNGESWAASIRGKSSLDLETGITLGDITTRISPGVATGADAIFVHEPGEVPQRLVPDWTRPTVSGTQLTKNDGPEADSVLICPYNDDGTLHSEDQLGVFGAWAKNYKDGLRERSCVQKDNKKWYAWHVKPPMDDMLQSKIVFRDISKEFNFWADKNGDIVPRNSVYYMIPKNKEIFDQLLDYLNSSKARTWMKANCQKAHGGFWRLQTRVLEKLPVPREFADSVQATIDY